MRTYTLGKAKTIRRKLLEIIFSQKQALEKEDQRKKDTYMLHSGWNWWPLKVKIAKFFTFV